jgi:hypothetical protein
VDDERRARLDAITARAAAVERQRSAETARARTLIDSFVREMQVRGVPPKPLRARVPGRRATYRTGRTGWYLRRNGSLAVGVDGAFYILETRLSWRARVFGASVAPSRPPLVVGRGGRDGEAVDLAALLRKMLPQ